MVKEPNLNLINNNTKILSIQTFLSYWVLWYSFIFIHIGRCYFFSPFLVNLHHLVFLWLSSSPVFFVFFSITHSMRSTSWSIPWSQNVKVCLEGVYVYYVILCMCILLSYVCLFHILHLKLAGKCDVYLFTCDVTLFLKGTYMHFFSLHIYSKQNDLIDLCINDTSIPSRHLY